MTAWLAIVVRELRIGWASGNWWLPIAFFLLVATLFPFAVGPEAALLSRVGGGILWVALLLAALMPIDRLVAPDLANGVIDRMALAGVSEESVAAAKLCAHLVGFAVPLALCLPVAAVLLAIPGEVVVRMALSFAVGAPGLAALSLMISGLTAGMRSGGGLAGMMLLPLAVPLLIFGAGALDPAGRGAMLYLGSVSLLFTAAAPFACGAAIRAAREA